MNISFEAIQNGGNLNRVPGNFILWLKSADYVKFTGKQVMCTEKDVLEKKKRLQMAKTWVCHYK